MKATTAIRLHKMTRKISIGGGELFMTILEERKMINREGHTLGERIRKEDRHTHHLKRKSF